MMNLKGELVKTGNYFFTCVSLFGKRIPMRFGVNRLALSSELVLIYLTLISSQRMIVRAKQGEQTLKK
jgi:hypothetical protein